ncbi:unnamed protein product [Caenorhabditis angaria]|uniref:Uncharacterized protein n=1 Tax=Caenorhabditis angaria TaxID=860376 RepID=A0A9P1IVF1_9PELO|nr:unnamed protein product [Caenorhabditis angaria]
MFGLNENCSLDKPVYIEILTHGASISSIPIYTITFYILIFKCPTAFDKYRILLLRHLTCCLFMEIHMSILWQFSLVLPYTSICANGIASNFPRFMFILLVFSIILTGYSIIDLFEYRMNVVTTQEQRIIKKCLLYYKFFCYFNFIITSGIGIAHLQYLTNDFQYKLNVEKKFGKMPIYLWCDTCIFARTDSITVIIFYGSCVFSVILAVQYSNFTICAVHLILIAVPSGIYLTTFFFSYSKEYMPLSYVCVALVTQHGSASTLTLITTNNSLRNVALEMENLHPYFNDYEQFWRNFVSSTKSCQKIWTQKLTQIGENFLILPKNPEKNMTIVSVGIDYNEMELQKKNPNIEMIKADEKKQSTTGTGKIYKYRISGNGMPSSYPALKTRNRYIEGGTSVGAAYFLRIVLQKPVIDMFWFDSMFNEQDIMHELHIGKGLDKLASDLVICQLNLRIYLNPTHSSQKIFHTFIQKLLIDYKFLIIRSSQPNLALIKLFLVNMRDPECIHSFIL